MRLTLFTRSSSRHSPSEMGLRPFHPIIPHLTVFLRKLSAPASLRSHRIPQSADGKTDGLQGIISELNLGLLGMILLLIRQNMVRNVFWYIISKSAEPPSMPNNCLKHGSSGVENSTRLPYLPSTSNCTCRGSVLVATGLPFRLLLELHHYKRTFLHEFPHQQPWGHTRHIFEK